MAHFHLTVKSGKSGCGGAHSDYIEREGKYAKRGDLEISGSGNMPNFAKDNPSEFWQMADEHERVNGRPYTEIEFSLPRGLSAEQRQELAQEYINNIVGDNHAYTFAIHNPTAKDGLENPHVHFMFSERTIDDRTSELSAEQFFKRNGATKNRAFSSQAFVWEARREWTRTANHFLERNDITTRIDDRSYKDRNIDLTSTNRKMFDQSYDMRRDLRDIQRENGDKIIDDPTIVLRALTSNDSTFTERDLETFIFRHTDGEEQYTRAYNSVIQSDEFVKINGKENYTTKELLAIEQNIVERTVNANKSESESLTAKQYHLNAKVIASRTFNEEQEQAFNKLSGNDQIVSVNGSAGTGKSYVLGALNEYYQADNKQVYGVALQAITAQAMQDDAGIKSSTIARFISNHDKGIFKLNKDSVIVLDEAGMVGSRDFQKLLSITQDSGAKIRMVGDSQQLNAVSAGNAYATIQEVLNKESQSSLVEIMRQRSEEMKSASMDLSKHDIKTALDKYEQLGKLNEFDTQESAQMKTAFDWCNSKSRSKAMLAYTNKDVQALNGYAREIMRDRGDIGKHDQYAQTYKGMLGFTTNDKIVFRENNKDMGVLNGSRGTILKVSGDSEGNAHSLAVQLDDGRKVNVDLNKYDKLVHGYATTIHASQGMTVEESHVLASKNMTANLAYVALTRHRADVSINFSREEFATKITRNGKEVTARENLATMIGSADVKTFTGKEIEEESFKHFKDQYTIDNRKTLAEKYNLRTQNVNGRDVVAFDEPTIQKAFGSIKSKWQNLTGKTAQHESAANSKKAQDLEARLTAKQAIETEKFNDKANAISAWYKSAHDHLISENHKDMASKLHTFVNNPKTDVFNRSKNDVLVDFFVDETQKLNYNDIGFSQMVNRNADIALSARALGMPDLLDNHKFKEAMEKNNVSKSPIYENESTHEQIQREYAELREQIDARAEERNQAMEKHKEYMATLGERQHASFFTKENSDRLHELNDRSPDAKPLSLKELDERSNLRATQHQQDLINEELSINEHGNDFITRPDIKERAQRMTEYKQELETKLTQATREYKAELKAEMYGTDKANDKAQDKLKDHKNEPKSIDEAKQDTLDADKKVDAFMEKQGTEQSDDLAKDKGNEQADDLAKDKGNEQADDLAKDKGNEQSNDDAINRYMAEHGLDQSNGISEEQSKEVDANIDRYMAEHGLDQSNGISEEQSKEVDANIDRYMEQQGLEKPSEVEQERANEQAQEQEQEQEWDMDR